MDTVKWWEGFESQLQLTSVVLGQVAPGSPGSGVGSGVGVPACCDQEEGEQTQLALVSVEIFSYDLP